MQKNIIMREILQIKVSLKGSKPLIWRRFLVPNDITFLELSNIILATMGWLGGHLSSFEVGNRLTIDVPSPFDVADFLMGDLNAKDVIVKEYLNQKGDKITYIYDFGDDWQHTLLVEKVLPYDSSMKYPVCLKGRRSCPPDDCGGIWGYSDLLATIADKDHPEHEEIMEWVGEDFDPDHFDVAAVNAYFRGWVSS